MITKKIESGKQLGTALRVYKDQQYSWYEYAVQKKDNIYYVYESEIEEKNIEDSGFLPMSIMATGRMWEHSAPIGRQTWS